MATAASAASGDGDGVASACFCVHAGAASRRNGAMATTRKGLIVIVSRIPGPPWTVNLPNKPYCGITVPSYLHEMGGLIMPDTLVFTEQIKKLEAFRHGLADSTALDEFDAETEQLILRTFREDTHLLEAYGLAIMGEAENIVNIPQSAQEDAAQDIPRKAIEQRSEERRVGKECRSR